MKFLSPLLTQKSSSEPGDFILYHNFKAEFEADGTKYLMTVPKGFITDFASVPKLVQLLPGFGQTGASANAAVVHDFCYCCRGDLMLTFAEFPRLASLELTRAQCDKLLYLGLRASGYSRVVAGLYYLGVRIGGWLYWYRRRRGLDVRYDFVPTDFDWSAP